MSIVLPSAGATASELSGFSSCPSDSDSSVFALPQRPKYKCSQCSLRFRRRDALDRHEVAAHGAPPRFRCTVTDDCKRVYTNSSHLRRHVRTAHKPSSVGGGELRADFVNGVKCSQVRSVQTLSSLLRVTPTKTMFPQDGCPRVFVSAAAMALHAAQTHLKRAAHQCPDCPERFHRKQQLKSHRYQHTGVYPYHCAKCSVGFQNKRLLTRHGSRCAVAVADQATTAKLKYQCSVCERSFGKWSELLTHRRVEHPARCERCGRTFATQVS